MKYLKSGLLIFLLFCLGTATVFSQDFLSIYGEGFAFKVSEPINFCGYTSDAYKYKIKSRIRGERFICIQEKNCLSIRQIARITGLR